MADTPTRKERRRQRRLERKAEAQNPQAAKEAKAQTAFEDGLARHQQGDLAGAEAAYREAIAAVEYFPEAHLNLGVVLHARGKLYPAQDSISTALAFNPDLAEAHYALGAVHQDRDNPEDALAGFQRALEIAPDFLLALNGQGIANQKLGHWEDAAESFERALTLNPGFTEAANNLGILRHRQGRLEDAMDCFHRALEVKPGYAKAHRNLSHVLLLVGNFEDGWKEFHWRWECSDFPTADRGFDFTHWRGEPLDGKKILVWGEQGVGDEVHFASMVPDLVDQGAEVILESDPRLVPLFERSFPGVTCVPKETPPDSAITDDMDFQIPSGDLGQWLRPGLDAFPDLDSFLIAEKAQTEALRKKYKNGGDDLLVGIAWISKNPEIGADKSIAILDWAPLADIPGITFIDLQYGGTEADRATFESETGTAIIRDETIDQMADLDAFAAQVAALDLVISVSNTTVHISGGLGVPTWVLLNTSPLCVWMQDGDTSPWYKSLKLFRQAETGDWAGVIARVEGELRAFKAAKG